MKKQINLYKLILFICLCISGTIFAQQIGDPGWIFDESKYDARIPAMREWAKAGVEGGIPFRDQSPVKDSLTANTEDADMAGEIQAAINKVAAEGGGVVLLKNGIFRIKSGITMKSNVILRGESREGTIIESTMRVIADPDNAKKFHEWDLSQRSIRFGELDNGLAWRKPTIYFNGVQKAALEDMTMIYRVWDKKGEYEGEEVFPTDTDYEPYKTTVTTAQRQTSFNENRYIYPKSASLNFTFDNPVRHDMFATFVKIDGENSKNLWIDNCSFLRSGTDHIFINAGSHITIRNTEVKGAFQKAGQGNGNGINSYGTYVLMVKCDVRKVRHWAIQKGAKYNVIYDSYSEVDINFHQDDLGSNIIENTKILIPQYHTWKNPFQVGAAYHRPPGTSNFFYNNDVNVLDNNLQDSKKFTDGKIYTFIDKVVKVSELDKPEHNALFAVKTLSGEDLKVNSVSLSPESLVLEVGNTRLLNATVSPSTATDKSVSWSSSDTSVVRINDSGKINAITKGEAEISVTTTDGNYTASTSVSVVDYDGSLINVALNKGANASSEPEAENSAANVLDGNTGTRWSAETFPQWVEIDLGALYTIGKTELVCFQDRAYQFIIEAKAHKDSSYVTIVDRSTNTEQGRANQPISDCFYEFDATYVRLTVVGASEYDGDWASLLEFRVFGQLKTISGHTGPSTQKHTTLIYPNPFYSTLNISFDHQMFHTFAIFDLSGKKMWTCALPQKTSMDIDLPYSTLPTGTYVARLVGDNAVSRCKIVRE